MRLVVLSELPRVRDTLLLRLLGNKPVREQALSDLAGLGSDAWEREVADPWLIRLGFQAMAADPSTLSPEDKEFAMDVHEWYKQYKQELAEHYREQYLARGLEQGRQEGQQEGLRPLAHQFERRLGRSLTPAEHGTLAERLHTQGPERLGDVVLDLSGEDLAAWLAATNER